MVIGILNNQVYLNRTVINDAGLNKDSINKWVMNYLVQQVAIERVVDLDALNTTTLNTNLKGGTTHGGWNPYDAHIPLLFYGWKIQQGASIREVSMADIAGTIASLLHIQMPSGSIGNVIEEIVK